MKTVIVYFTKFGNTKRIAETIGEAVRQAGEVRVVGIDQVSPADFEGVDLVLVGSPTHGFTSPEAVQAALAKWPAGILAGKAVATFDTTVKVWPLKYLRASPRLLRRLGELGGKPIAPPETFFVQTRNPQKSGEINLLLDGQLDHARRWAGTILDRCK